MGGNIEAMRTLKRCYESMLVQFEGYFYRSMAQQQAQKLAQKRQIPSPQRREIDGAGNANQLNGVVNQPNAQQMQQHQLFLQQQKAQQQAFHAQKQAVQQQQQQQKDAKTRNAQMNARNLQALQHQRLIAASNPIQTRFLSVGNLSVPEVKLEEDVKEEEVKEEEDEGGVYKPMVVKTQLVAGTHESEWWAGIPLGILYKVREPVRTICAAVIPKEVIGLSRHK
jgi:hypothetical protein